MRKYSEQEICLLLLTALPGEEKPLGLSQYRKLMHAARALGPGSADPERDVSREDLVRLGCSGQEAKEIILRLSRRETLMRYLSSLERKGITLVTRISPEYPRRLWNALGDRAPLVLYCGGNVELFSRKAVSLVGSRELREKGKAFSSLAGHEIARQGLVYCSGGARGADTLGYESAMKHGGCAVLFLADSLVENMKKPLYRQALQEGRLLLVSETGADQEFTTYRALSRNRLIHAFGERTLVAQSDYGFGGTWSGTVDNLKNRWSPVFVCNSEPADPGTKGLLERGGNPVSVDELSDFGALGEAQLSLEYIHTSTNELSRRGE